MFKLVTIVLLTVLVIAGCGKYSRGDRFKANFAGDSLMYVVFNKGYGEKISEIASQMKVQYEMRGNNCVITYLTDSVSLNEKKGLLLFNSTLPNIENDILSKGFIGQFNSKQIVSYLLVANEDIDKYFIKSE